MNWLTMNDPRIIDSPLGPVIPVVDIAKQVGCSRTTISHTMQRHPALFKDVTSIQWLETPSGRQKHTCIAKSAVEDLISHLRPINRDNLPERIDTFRVAQIRKNSTVARPCLIFSPNMPGRQAFLQKIGT